MKEQYLDPEMKIVCFAPVQSLANTDPLDIATVFGLESTGPGGEAGESDNDFGIEIP